MRDWCPCILNSALYCIALYGRVYELHLNVPCSPCPCAVWNSEALNTTSGLSLLHEQHTYLTSSLNIILAHVIFLKKYLLNLCCMINMAPDSFLKKLDEFLKMSLSQGCRTVKVTGFASYTDYSIKNITAIISCTGSAGTFLSHVTI